MNLFAAFTKRQINGNKAWDKSLNLGLLGSFWSSFISYDTGYWVSI